MGGTSNIIDAYFSTGSTVTAGPIGRVTGVSSSTLDPAGTAVTKKKNARLAGTTGSFLSEAERQREARVAAAKRKKDYQDMGRSATILTGPMGLGGSGSGESKTLLGY